MANYVKKHLNTILLNVLKLFEGKKNNHPVPEFTSTMNEKVKVLFTLYISKMNKNRGESKYKVLYRRLWKGEGMQLGSSFLHTSIIYSLTQFNQGTLSGRLGKMGTHAVAVHSCGCSSSQRSLSLWWKLICNATTQGHCDIRLSTVYLSQVSPGTHISTNPFGRMVRQLPLSRIELGPANS